MKPSIRGVSALLGLVVVFSGALQPAVALAQGATGAEVSSAVRHDVSRPLRNVRVAAPSAANLTERPLRRLNVGQGNGPDAAQQTSTGGAVSVTSGTGFEGVGQGQYGFGVQYAPPDTVGAVGATQYVQWVNTYFAVFDKTTGQIVPGFPKPGNAIWAGFTGGCETNNDGDPIVQYDKIADRWILTQFSVSTTPYLQCVAVSTSSDATGSYNRYAFSYGTSTFNDYPKLAVWPDAYYISFNMFVGNSFTGAKVCAYDRAAMVAGGSATQQCFQLSSLYGGLLPSDVDGSTTSLQPGGAGLPPAGTPDMFMNFGTSSLNLWRFHVDWSNSANTTLTGPSSIAVAAFSAACNGGGTCVPQPGTQQKLDSLADRLMYRLAYRHFADGHEALVVNQSVTANSATSVRWYELRNATGSTMAAAKPVVYQQSTLNNTDGTHRWMGSAAMDSAGDIALGYTASSASVYPSVRMTGRLASDALNTMSAETELRTGHGSQLANLSRWGDYSAMTIDPVDDCTFWYTSEHMQTNGTWNWNTWIQPFKFSSCGTSGGPTTGTLSGTVTGASSAPINGATVSISGGPSTATDASGNYSFNIAGGNYTVTASATGYNSSSPANVTVSNGATTTQDFALTPVSSTATVPATPASPTGQPATGKGIVVNWVAPNDGGSPITGYTLKRYTATSTACSLTLSTTFNLSNVLSYKDASTSRSAYYCYSVTAANSVGSSGESTKSSPIRAK